MHIIKPVGLTFLSASEPENDAAVWSSGTTYGFSDIVMKDGLVYVSSIDGNVGLDPADEEQSLTGARWVLRGATNIRRFLDQSPSSKTTGGTPLVLEVTVSERFNAIALLGLKGSQITIEVITNGSSQQVAQFATGAEPVDNWWDWLHTNFYPNRDRYVQTGISGAGGATVRITIVGISPELGQIIAGRSVKVGTTRMGGATKMRRRTFTKIETNDFGDVSVTKRAITRDITYSVIAERGGFGSVESFLDEVDGARVVTFATDGWDQFINYGFVTDWELPADMPDHFQFEITSQGVS